MSPSVVPPAANTIRPIHTSPGTSANSLLPVAAWANQTSATLVSTASTMVAGIRTEPRYSGV